MKKQYGFTLIELLVVISIIAVLMSIMMPALNKVRQQARATVCMTSMRNLGTASMTYSADHDNQYPMAGSRNITTGGLDMWGGGYPHPPYWDARLIPYIAPTAGLSPRTTATAALSSINSAVFDIFLCPGASADPSQKISIDRIRNGLASPDGQVRANNIFPRSYRINGSLTGHSDISRDFPSNQFRDKAYRRSIPISMIKDGSRTPLIFESNVTDGSCYNSIYGWAGRAWGDIKPVHFNKYGDGVFTDTWGDTSAREGIANICFADGSTAKIKRSYTTKYWKYGGEPDTVGIKFLAVGQYTAAETGLK